MTLFQGTHEGGTNASWRAEDVRSDLPAVTGSSVGLPPHTIYVDPSNGKLYKTT